MGNSSLQRNQLERIFVGVRAIEASLQPPTKGWINAIRTALEMPLSTMAKKFGQTIQGASDLESRESKGTVTLATLREAAEAMDCRLIYAILPNKPLGEIIEVLANQVATQMFDGVANSMALEGQSTSSLEANEARQMLTGMLMSNPKKIWRAIGEI